MFTFLLSHHIFYFMLIFCNSFHEFNFEIENVVKVNDETESGNNPLYICLSSFSVSLERDLLLTSLAQEPESFQSGA